MEIVARAAPDGYTIAMMINAHAVNTTLYEKLPFDPVADFTTIVLAATTANVLVVHPAVPVTTVAELVALAKRDPGALNYASGGSGTTSHLAAELFKTMTGTSMTHVPYKGGGAAYKDMLGGQVQLSFTGLPGVAEFIRAGKLRAIAVTTPARSNALPGVPTIAETLPGFEFTTWWGIVGPPGLPRPIVARIHDEVTRAVQLPELKEKFAVQGFEFAPSTPESFGAFLREEIARWGKVVKASGARAE
jgi:tripartite-type tricarboxylate transporter receptor subunit TctC